jgi:hypothetical protein
MKGKTKKRPKTMDHLYNWKLIMWVGPVVCAFIGGLIYIIANVKVHNLDAEIKAQEGKKVTTTGIITPAKVNSVVIPRYITLIVGSNKIQIDSRLLTKGNSFKPLEWGLGYDFPLSIKLNREGNILVDCNFKDLSGKIVAEMINNEWEINPNNFFKRNYDDHGVEIIDQEGIMKLQIDFIDNDKLKIGGIIKDSRQVHFISDAMIESTDNGLINKDKITKLSETIPNMFIYPADKNLGLRAKK